MLVTRQNEYDVLTAKYYAEMNQASSRHAESSSSSAYYESEYSRIKKSLENQEAELENMSVVHRQEVRKLDDIINQQREELATFSGKL